METEVTVAVRALVRWHLEDGKPVVDGVEVISPKVDAAEAVRIQIAGVTAPDGALH